MDLKFSGKKLRLVIFVARTNLSASLRVLKLSMMNGYSDTWTPFKYIDRCSVWHNRGHQQITTIRILGPCLHKERIPPS